MSNDPNQPNGFPPPANLQPGYPPVQAPYGQPGPAYGQPFVRDMSTTAMVLGICFIILSLFGIVGAFMMKTLMPMVMANVQAQNPSAPVLPSSFGNGLAIVVGLFFGLIPLLAGVGLVMKASWGRVAAIVASVFLLFSFPFGTVLAICALVFLLRSGAADGYKLLSAPRTTY